MSGAPQQEQRLGFLDCIRGVAALAVLVEHVGIRVSPHMRDFVHNSFDFGKFGVTAFFLTSGFIIPFTLERSNSLKRFWISRFFRLYPLYWFSLIIVLGSYFFGMTDAVGPGFADHVVRNTLVNITMFQEFFRVPNAEGLYYTLGMELAFYLFASLLLIKKWNHRSLQIAWIASPLLFLVGVLAPVLLHRRVPMAGLFYFLCFLIGTAIYRNYTSEVSGKKLALLLAFVGLSMVAEVYCNYVLVKKDDIGEQFTLYAVLLPWLAAYAVFLSAYINRRHKFPKMFVWLGAISYSVYLLHPSFARLIPGERYGVLYFLVVLGVTLGVSALTYRFLEQPCIQFGRKLQRRLSSTVVYVAPTTTAQPLASLHKVGIRLDSIPQEGLGAENFDRTSL